MEAFLKAAFPRLVPFFFISALVQFGTVGGFNGNRRFNAFGDFTKKVGKATPTKPLIALPGFTFEVGPQKVDESVKRDLVTKFLGSWKLASQNSMVSAMHMNLLPNNKMIIFDASIYRISKIKLPNGKCLPYISERNVPKQDCWAHGVEFDVATAKIRPLTMTTDPWCSSGGLDVQGRLVSVGGWKDGTRSVRYLNQCNTCDWKEYPMSLARGRWYASQVTMADGGFLVVGGRRSFNIEFIPAEGKTNARPIRLPFLDETTDLDENNLYPFVYLSTDGNVFIFANSRSILFNPKTRTVIHEYPILAGGSRNYPASAMSVLLPLKLQLDNSDKIPAEVLICGGALPEAYRAAEKKNFMPALKDCNRLVITNPKDVWKKETMPTPRVMGDMVILPNGDVLMINGATTGTSAWNFAESPLFNPVLYIPDNPQNSRFKVLLPSKIPRMYHSTAALLADGQILVAGSNTNPGYNYKVKYPTELRVERFSPPYLDPVLAKHRPVINVKKLNSNLKYGVEFNLDFNMRIAGVLNRETDIRITMYPPPFTTHGYSMNQRLVFLAIKNVVGRGLGVFSATVSAPPSGNIAPPGYYMMFVVYRGIPSVGVWVVVK